MLLAGALNDNVAAAIAAATAVFPVAADSEMQMILFKNNPTLSPETVLADLEEATFEGYIAVEVGAGSVQTALDPVTGQWMLRPREPVGGFQYLVDGTENIPQTIYGFALTNQGKTVLIASEKFAVPITLTAQDQVVDVPQPILRLAFQPLT